jgi:hypothetical protein
VVTPGPLVPPEPWARPERRVPPGLREILVNRGPPARPAPRARPARPGTPGSITTAFSSEPASVTTTVGQGQSFIIAASCPAGTQLLGGGATSVSQEADIVSDIASSAPLVSNGQPTNTWTALFKVDGQNALGDTFQIDVVAYCGNIAS